MHRKLPSAFFSALFLATLSLLISACAPSQTELEVETSADESTRDAAQVETHALLDQSIADLDNPLTAEPADPWELVNSSANIPPAQANAALLQASELFLDQQHYSTAYTMFEEIDASWLDEGQNRYFALLRARYALLTGDTARAQSLLNSIPRNIDMSRENQARLLQLDIAIAAQQLDFRRAVLARIELDPLLDPATQLINQRRILNTLSRETGLFTVEERLTPDARLQGWLALSELNRTHRLMEPDLGLWQQQYPLHPARIEELLLSAVGSRVSSQQIALLLPTTSKLGRAAQAFKAGFDAAVEKSGRFEQSREYDIGAETDLVGLYYQSAVNDGADFIIGPLGRTAAQALLGHLETTENPGVSTLLLGELGNQQNLIPNLWGLSLSPEQDATAIAERAISQGMRSAAILQKDNDWGTRLADAFSEAFTAKGGRVIVNQAFQADKKDHSAEVKKLLSINDSDLRHQQLENLLGTRLEFSVRRRNDIDFIFLAGNTRDARRLVPLARFYRAHDLPVYATASAFNGKFNKLTDEDLKGLQFADLPWMLKLQQEAQQRERARLAAEKAAAEALAQAAVQENSPAGQQGPQLTETAEESEQLTEEIKPDHEELPYTSATLNRLYALGYAAYEAIPQLGYLQSDEWYRFDTHTLSLNMDEARNLRHVVAWGQYAADGITVSN